VYRKLIWAPILAFLILAVAMAYLAGGPGDFRQLLPVGAAYARLNSWLPANAAGDLQVGAAFFLTGLAPWLAAAGLTWLAAFHPARRAGQLLVLVKYLAGAAVVTLVVAHSFYRAAGVANAAYALEAQTGRPLPVALLSGGLLQTLVEMAALAMLLAAPLYWVVRGTHVKSLRRATFEAWGEAKRLLLPSLALLTIAAALNVWATPALATMLLR
jgi:hypothetical protein